MPSLLIDISIQQQIVSVDVRALRKTVRYVLKTFGVINAAVSVAVVDNQTMQKLKKQYFNQSRATDVISFDLSDSPPNQTSRTPEWEIVVNAQRAAEVALRKSIDPVAELHLYVVHGLLHQLGFADQNLRCARRMHQKEDELLETLGFGPAYTNGKES